jgi:hypothetical protein
MARVMDWGTIEEDQEMGKLIDTPLLMLLTEPWVVAGGEMFDVVSAERRWLAGHRNPERRFTAARSAGAIVALMREDAAAGFAPYRAAVQAAGCRAVCQLISPLVAAEEHGQYDEQFLHLLERQCGAPGCPTACGSGAEGAPRDLKLKLCVGCLAVSYCSTTCQHAHWPDHKAACKAARVARTASSAHAAAAAQDALAAGALDAIVAALATHAADAGVLLDGCAALALVVDHAQAAAAAVAAGAPAAVLAAFGDGTDALVKAAACAAVVALATALDAACAERFREVLQRAVATHPACAQLHKRAAVAREALQQGAAAGAAA